MRDLGAMIEEARRQVATTADATAVKLYWQIGYRVRTEVLEGRRADYGTQVVTDVGNQLSARYGRGFGLTNLHPMVKFSWVFDDPKIVAALLQHLGWTHEVLDLDARGIHVTELPPRAVLEDRLHRAIKAARDRFALGADADFEIKPPAATRQPRTRGTASRQQRARR